MKGANKLAGWFGKKLGYKMMNDMKPHSKTVIDELRHFIDTGIDELPPDMERITLYEISKGDRTKIFEWRRKMAEYEGRYER